MTEQQYIAVDLGAESGRVMLGTVAGGKMSLKECHRFGNGPIEENDSLRWDFAGLWKEIKIGIAEAVQQSEHELAGIGVDSWGVDIGFLDSQGNLLEKPYHYRDKKTNGIPEKAYELMPKRDIYEHTGLQFLQFNTVYQLLALRLAGADVLNKAKHMVMIADLVGYYLSGKIYAEYSLASTSQMMNMKTGQWDDAIFKQLDLPRGIMPEIAPMGSVVGHLKNELAQEFGCAPLPVIASGSHDTACAVVGVPASNPNWAYLSSGTWSLMGLEVPQAIINDKTFGYEFTNEGGAFGTIRLLKNIMGLWLVQECRRHWQKEGEDLSYGQITDMAAKAKPLAGKIDPDWHEFLAPGDMPLKINRYLESHGQKPLTDKGQMIRIVLESLADKYKSVLKSLEDVNQGQVEVLHIVGGGIQNELLCQFTADATGKKAIAGPVEATAIGNVIMQGIAAKQIGSLAQGREIIGNSYPLKEYLPQ